MIYRLSIPALLFVSVKAKSQADARALGLLLKDEISEADFYIAEGHALLERMLTVLRGGRGSTKHEATMHELRGSLVDAIKDPAGVPPMASFAHNNGNGGVVIEDESAETLLMGSDLWWKNLCEWVGGIDEDAIDEDDESIQLGYGCDVVRKEDVGRYAIIEVTDGEVWVYTYGTPDELAEGIRTSDNEWDRQHVIDLETAREIEYTTHITLVGLADE